MLRFAPVALATLILTLAVPAHAQLTLPPEPDSERSTVTQQIGPVTVSIEYSSPRVTRGKNDRHGSIWGKLVPYGLVDLGFGTCKQCPWRAGANENTVFTTSHAVKIQGQPLPAGRYGLSMIPGPEEWTIIFSNDSTAWGSFFYEPTHDALRVQTHSAKSEDHEWLTYEFTEREAARATVALKWEELQIPFTITVDDPNALWLESLRRELLGNKGFYSENLRQAAEFCVTHNVALPEGLRWAERAVSEPFIGHETFTTLMTLSKLQGATGHEADAARTFDKAIAHPTATPSDLHQAGRGLLAAGKKAEAMKVFQANAKRFPNQWPVHVSLMRGYSATGDLKRALAEARLAVPQAPDPANRAALEAAVKTLESGKPVE
jgi:hypothetical protein